MKVWFGYGSEHSANMVIIGTFKTTTDASEAHALLEKMIHVAQADEAAGTLKPGTPPTKATPAMLEFAQKEETFSFGPSDFEALLYDFSQELDGKKFVITTEEDTYAVFIKLMVEFSAKVEVYSAHDYAGPYGRATASS